MSSQVTFIPEDLANFLKSPAILLKHLRSEFLCVGKDFCKCEGEKKSDEKPSSIRQEEEGTEQVHYCPFHLSFN